MILRKETETKTFGNSKGYKYSLIRMNDTP